MTANGLRHFLDLTDIPKPVLAGLIDRSRAMKVARAKGQVASPLAGNNHLYLVDEDGVLQTIQLGGAKGQIASRLELDERIMCTPALANGALYVRSDKHLWKFSKRQ